jgi:SAM-dependent methyltransferase
LTRDHLDPYRDAVRAHGGGFEATLWGSPETQRLRFDVLTSMITLDALRGSRVLDLGCGDGALAQVLCIELRLGVSYIGLDAMPEMVEAARAKAIPRCVFERCDLTDDAPWPASRVDWVLLSGTLNTMNDALAMQVLDRSWSLCTRGLAFNMLGDRPGAAWKDRPLGPSIRRSVVAMQAWALERTALVELRQDYMDGHDVSLVLRRSPSQS